MNEKKKWNLKYILTDSNLLRDVKTVAAFLLAYAVAVVSNGLIEGFTPAALISIVVGLGAFGTFFSIRIVTNEFTDRGMFDEEQTNEELKKRIQRQKELSTNIKSSIAYDILVEYNKDKLTTLKKQKYNSLKHKYEIEIKRLDNMIENVKVSKRIKWFSFASKWVIARLKKRKNKTKSKLAKLVPEDVFVRYKPITLQQLRVANVQEGEDKFNEAQRFSVTPQKKVRNQMAVTNFIKTFFFVGFQGAAIATVTSWVEFFIFLVLISLTLATTALSSYVGVRRYANFNYISILDEKLEKLSWLIEETKKRDKEIEKTTQEVSTQGVATTGSVQ